MGLGDFLLFGPCFFFEYFDGWALTLGSMDKLGEFEGDCVTDGRIETLGEIEGLCVTVGAGLWVGN